MVDINKYGDYAKLFFKGRYFIRVLKTIPCYAVFYTDKMVVAIQDAKGMKAETKRVKAELKNQKVGLLKRGKRIAEYWEN